MKTIAIIPAFNEEKTIAKVLDQVRGFVDEMIVVDDGSSDETYKQALQSGAIVLVHVINRGLGAALGTGFEAVKKLGADIAITLDSDGQHDPKEIPNFIKAIEEGVDVVIGSRLLNPKGMPWHRILANTVGNIVTFLLFGAWVTDSQSGYRAFNKKALEKIRIRTNRMEVSSEIVSEVKRQSLKLKEIPIQAIYTTYSLSKGQSFMVGIKTLIKLLVRRIS
ncbi:MAG: glycosyltransferase family 2 protein [Patescibacteria group bacterium]